MTLHDPLQQCEPFPDAPLHAHEMLLVNVDPGVSEEAAQALCSMNIRPFPERVDALVQYGFKPFTRQRADALFALCENLSPAHSFENLSPAYPFENVSPAHPFENVSPAHPFEPSKTPDFDPGYEPLSQEEVLSLLHENPANMLWIENCLQRFSRAYHIPLEGDIIHDARIILDFLYGDVAMWEADAFPLDCMACLPNRYNWTFTSNAWSLREQLRQEALIVKRSWRILLKMAQEQPLFFIINERTPGDYFTSFLPRGATLFSETDCNYDAPVLMFQGVKISSSEHRVSLNGTLEGENLIRAMELAQKLGRRPVLCDLSRRRFPRSFLRVARFALEQGFGIFPMGKLFDRGADKIPEAKSAKGFPVIKAKPNAHNHYTHNHYIHNHYTHNHYTHNDNQKHNQNQNHIGGAGSEERGKEREDNRGKYKVNNRHSTVLTLFDPWPVSDLDIIEGLSEQEKRKFCHGPKTKPWQDDRIGARVEMELDANGIYRAASSPWVVPVMGKGWMEVDNLFKSRLGRFLDE